MPVILKIGCNEYLIKSETQAQKAIAALIGIIPLESKHLAGKEIYWPPEHDYRGEISVRMVRQDQLRAGPPEDLLKRSKQLALPPASGGES